MQSHLRLQISYCFFESGEVLRTGKNGEIRIAAKLGCAVEHACLAAHEQRLYSMRLDRRKDFEYRVQCQASHQRGNRIATTVLIRASVLPVKVDTMRPILRRQVLQVESSYAI